jgi:SAM-dependent methyltransferase
MFGHHIVAVGMCLLLMTVSVGAQSADDQTWGEFLTYMKGSPPVNGPLEMIQGFQRSLAAKGLQPPEIGQRMNTVLRLMRDREDAWPLMFDKIYVSATPNFSVKPNATLMAAIEGRKPGRALDVGMGQGRNALGLAGAGWDVTGFDVSAEGLAVAKAQAAKAGVKITALQESSERFDFGTGQWDLIAMIYVPNGVEDPAYAQRILRALRPGGLVVIESFASDRQAAMRRPVDIDPASLLKAFADFRILRFEDTDGVTDWDPQTTTLVRLVAQKKP